MASPRFFTQIKPGRYALAPSEVERPPGPEHVAGLLERLEPARLRGYGWEGGAISPGAVRVAAGTGMLSNPAFLEVVEAGLERRECLCCFGTASRAAAERVSEAIGLIRGYFSQQSYEESAAFYRNLSLLLRDVTPRELAALEKRAAKPPRELRNHLRRMRGAPGVLPVALPHGSQGEGLLGGAGYALFVYSTPGARKYLRRLQKKCKDAGLSFRARLGHEEEEGAFPLLWQKRRAYAIECFQRPGGGVLRDFWKCAAEAAAAALDPAPEPVTATPPFGGKAPSRARASRTPRRRRSGSRRAC